MSIISVQNITKSFKTYKSEWHRVLGWMGVHVAPLIEKTILEDISFEVEAGQAIGLIGQNGAGKSTLLKIISGTMQANAGSVSLNGRVSALLELGMGFNPDMTGRANVWNTAGLMGFDKDQIENVMADIEAFAEIGSYFDEPIRTYSSGMQVRLAFSVATAFRPDILIVDEALSVGDAYFQHKSFARIREFQEQGTTLLLVSHDRASVASLCDRALLIHEGRVAKDGDPEEVLDFYNALVAAREGSKLEQIKGADGRVRTISGTGEATIENIQLVDENDDDTESLLVGDKAAIIIDVAVKQPIPELVVGYMIKDRLGRAVFGTNSFHTKQILTDLKAGESYRYKFEFDVEIGHGNYSIQVALHQSDSHITKNYEWRDLALTFTVANTKYALFEGTSWIPPKLSIEPFKV